MTLRVAFDLDGTAFDLDGGVVDAYHSWHGVKINRSERWNDLVLHSHFTDWDGIFAWLAQVPEFWERLDPIPGAIGTLHALSASADVDVVVATARPGSAEKGTLRCLERWGLGHIPVVFGNDKSRADAHVYVDDSPDVLKALAKAGHPAIRFKQPWNSNDGIPGAPADNWADVKRMIVDYVEVLA